MCIIFSMPKEPETLEQKHARIKAKRDKELAQIDAQIKAKNARETQKRRKADTRRKIIAGGLALVHLARNENTEYARLLAKLIDEYTISDADRALFDLDPLPREEQKNRRVRHRAERKKRGETEAPF